LQKVVVALVVIKNHLHYLHHHHHHHHYYYYDYYDYRLYPGGSYVGILRHPIDVFRSFAGLARAVILGFHQVEGGVVVVVLAAASNSNSDGGGVVVAMKDFKVVKLGNVCFYYYYYYYYYYYLVQIDLLAPPDKEKWVQIWLEVLIDYFRM